MISRRKRIAFTVITLCFPLTILMLALEITLRFKQSKAISTESRRILDQEIGWRPRPNLAREGLSKDAINQVSQFRMTQDAHGFRQWGDTTSLKPRILVIGDSYTQADDIDDSKTFYALLAQRMPEAEFWTFGCSGYGTFQQSMIVAQYASEIRPDVVLIQMSSNDLVNNLKELEAAIPFVTTPGPRPYLIDDGTTEHYFATRHRGLSAYSKLFGSLSDRLDDFRKESDNWVPGKQRKIGTTLNQESLSQLIKKATIKTATILNSIKTRLGPDTRLIAFYDEDVQPLGQALQQACLDAQIPLIQSIGPKMMKEEGRLGYYHYRTRDLWHWNNDGHKLVADLLETPLRQALELASPDQESTPKAVPPIPPVIARDSKAGDQPR
ncbi:MAG: SGNH/GDSL hydrolase family protein [Planctomycetota bacterium]|nr:SGNH/GDSL hydrolase family protein [Planctomycetota bacterium]